MINEQNTQKFDYFMTKDDGFNEETSGKALYFVKNGDTFDVWFENQNGEILSSGTKLLNTKHEWKKLLPNYQVN